MYTVPKVLGRRKFFVFQKLEKMSNKRQAKWQTV